MAVSLAPPSVPSSVVQTAPLLDLQDVHVHFEVRAGLLRFRRVEAVRGVSLQLRHGETVAVVGESGSGKTTLGRVTIGQARPTAGRVLFDGQDLARLRGKERKQFQRRAQAIFQDPFSSLDPYMTLYESLSEPLEIHRIDTPRLRQERIYQALQDVRLTPVREMAAAYPHMISGGQRQRLGIARALIMQPEFLFADEPVSMVDASSRAEILYLLRELQDQHQVAILYITHDIATAVHSAQRIVVMYLGRVVEVGPRPPRGGQSAASLCPGPDCGGPRTQSGESAGPPADARRRTTQPHGRAVRLCLFIPVVRRPWPEPAANRTSSCRKLNRITGSPAISTRDVDGADRPVTLSRGTETCLLMQSGFLPGHLGRFVRRHCFYNAYAVTVAGTTPGCQPGVSRVSPGRRHRRPESHHGWQVLPACYRPNLAVVFRQGWII